MIRDTVLIVAGMIACFAFPFACGAIFDYADAHSAVRPVGGSIGYYIAR